MSKTTKTLPKKSSTRIALIGLAAILMLVALACVRSAAGGEDASQATEKVAQTADAEIQMTLDALLGSATVESAAATVAPTSTATPAPVTATATVEQAQLTELAASLTAAASTPVGEAAVTDDATATATKTPNPTASSCYGARYVYDESYPDGTRVDPGQTMAKTWRLQNVGTCDWQAGQYELYFVGGDRMAGTYANFTINLKAPTVPGTYHGDWILRLSSGDVIGVGPDFDLPIWVEIIVRGATPVP